MVFPMTGIAPRIAVSLLFLLSASAGARAAGEDERFLDELERRSCAFFIEQANPTNGLVPDRADADGRSRDPQCSVAGIGFGLSALCIAETRGWLPREDTLQRARAALRFALHDVDHENGFFYHFINYETGARIWGCEVSSIDTALLLCGALVARQHFDDPEITGLATRLYERVDWPWMLNGGQTLCNGWTPGYGFSRHRWHGYAEHMAMYLLGLGSPTHPLPQECWYAWRREPVATYGGMTFIAYPPLFVHQYAHAFVDFRGFADDYADYWQNSVFATLAQRRMAMELKPRFPELGEKMWGITSSDSAHGYKAWGGPPPTPNIDGTLSPCAAAGSIPFAPRECIDTLKHMKERYGDRIWKRYGFVDAFNPQTGWVAQDVLAIDLGITLIMAENFRTGLIWDRFMANREVATALQAARFRPAPLLAANTSLVGGRELAVPSRRPIPRFAVARALPRPEFEWDWQTIDAANARESVSDGDNRIFARFAFGWDAQALHVRVAVTDPMIVAADTLNRLHNKDAVEIFVDPENNGLEPGGRHDFHFDFAVTNQSYAWAVKRPLVGASVLATNDGYRVIASIPWKLLEVEPEAGKQIGLSLAVHSVSEEDEAGVKLNWHWREEKGVIRLGTVTLEGPTTTNQGGGSN